MIVFVDFVGFVWWLPGVGREMESRGTWCYYKTTNLKQSKIIDVSY